MTRCLTGAPDVYETSMRNPWLKGERANSRALNLHLQSFGNGSRMWGYKSNFGGKKYPR